MRAQTGFTLIELMTTLAVLAICTTIGMPALRQFVEWQRTLAAMESLTTHMALARMAAITHGRPAVLCPSVSGASCAPGSDWSRGWMLFLDDDGDRSPGAGEEVLRTDLEPTSRHLRVVGTSGRTSLRYLPDGRSAGANLTISVCSLHGDLLGAVIVNNMGRSRRERPRAPSPCPG